MAVYCSQCDKTGNRKDNVTKWERNNMLVGTMMEHLESFGELGENLVCSAFWPNSFLSSYLALLSGSNFSSTA